MGREDAAQGGSGEPVFLALPETLLRQERLRPVQGGKEGRSIARSGLSVTPLLPGPGRQPLPGEARGNVQKQTPSLPARSGLSAGRQGHGRLFFWLSDLSLAIRWVWKGGAEKRGQ